MQIGPNEPCWCGSGSKYKKCHRLSDEASGGPPRRPGSVRAGHISPRRPVPANIPRPPWGRGLPPDSCGPSVPNPPDVIARMRRAGKAAAEVLAEVGRAVAVGVTTDHLDAVGHAAYLARGGYPSTLGYPSRQGAPDYPKSMCTSVNEVVLHGIPDDRPLADGDIVTVDVTIFLDGVHGDTNATFLVGDVDEASRRLVRVTRECLERGIEAVKPGKPVSEIGRAIEPYARKHGYGEVQSYGGHGIDTRFHTDFHVAHHYERRATDRMLPGMTFTIEPMLTMGTHELVRWADGWTEATADGKRSAQFEHTILVTETGAEVLTR